MNAHKCLFLCFIAVVLVDAAALAQEKDKGTSSPPDEVNKLIQQEIALEDKGDLTGAIEINRKISQLQPNNPRPLNVIAGLYGKLENFEAEIAWAQKAIALDPQFALAYINYGNAMASLGKFEEAKGAFNKAAELKPRDPIAFYSLGIVAEQQKRFDDAMSFYRKSVELDPRFENGYFNLAALYANLKRYDEAVAALRKVLEINPRADDARAMLADIQKQQGSKR
jgi:tetratricopeptide (TPR) repeat protein